MGEGFPTNPLSLRERARVIKFNTAVILSQTRHYAKGAPVLTTYPQQPTP